MAWRFRKSFKIAPGVRLNVSKKGLGMSAGVKGARVGVSPGGRAYTSTSIPGTGLYAISYLGASSRSSSTAGARVGAGCVLAVAILSALFVAMVLASPIMFWLVIAASVGGWLYYRNTPEQKAKRIVKSAAGFLDRGDYESALPILKQAYALAPTEERKYFVAAALNNLGRHSEAVRLFEELHKSKPNDDNLRILLAHNYFKTGEYDKAIPLAQGIREDSAWHIKAISITGACFAEQAKHELAIETLSRAPLRKRNLDDDLLEIHYNLAESYRETGNRKKAIQHFNRVYAQNAEYEDVAQKLDELQA